MDHEVPMQDQNHDDGNSQHDQAKQMEIQWGSGITDGVGDASPRAGSLEKITRNICEILQSEEQARSQNQTGIEHGTGNGLLSEDSQNCEQLLQPKSYEKLLENLNEDDKKTIEGIITRHPNIPNNKEGALKFLRGLYKKQIAIGTSLNPMLGIEYQPLEKIKRCDDIVTKIIKTSINISNFKDYMGEEIQTIYFGHADSEDSQLN